MVLGGLAGLGGATIATVVAAPPALAHGLGERTDLPLPLGYFLGGSAIAVITAFAVTSWFWPRPRLADAAEGRTVPHRVEALLSVATIVLRAAGIALFALVLSAALVGDDLPSRNLAPVAVYVWFWVGLQILSALAGDAWAALSPYRTISWAFARRVSSGMDAWTAPLLLLSFVWLELAYHDPASPRAIGTWMAVYSVAVLAGLVAFGRDWLASGEGFAALFGLEARMAPLYLGDDGRHRLRAPLAGLATVRPNRGTAALIMVALGATAFDGVTGTTFWSDVTRTSTGWAYTVLNTVGLLWLIGLAAVVYLAATRATARVAGIGNEEAAHAFLPSLVPIVLGYVVAHYFSLVVYEGQLAIALISDPYGRGWDLFGTATHTIDYGVVSESTVAWVQVAAIVVGHVVGVVVAHDRAVELFPREVAVRSQVPLVVAMVVYTVGGLALLLGG